MNTYYSVIITTFVLSFLPPITWAQTSSSGAVSAPSETGGSFLGYDSIVEELSKTSTPLPSREYTDPFAEIEIHGGIGLASSYLTLSEGAFGQKVAAAGLMKGFEASFGIDLFSRYWMAEGAIRSFSSENLNSQVEANLREFDLKVVYHTPFARSAEIRLGLGLAARYLEVQQNLPGEGQFVNKYTTPSSIALLGLAARLSRSMSLGVDVSYRSALIDESIDQSSLDGALKINAHF